ncbi:Protein of unknown function [Rhodospirillales bacterium URHD0017]|nr:Protein of unknown function [Rhodospirillales bacterium URHD0017]
MVDGSSLLICVMALVAMFGGGLIGIFTARVLPPHHLSDSSASVVKLLATVVVSLTSLVLALMLSSANNSFSVNAGIVKKLSSDLIHLDHLLRTYGPEANEARATLRAYTTRKSDELFPASAVPAPSDRETSDRLDALLDSILSLAPTDRRHTALVEQALGITSSIYAERWLLWENPGTTVPPQFLFVLIFWLFLIFVSFGLFAPANHTVIASFLLCALAVSGAILMILDMGDPMHPGWVQVSGEPMRRAVIEVSRP